MADYQEGQTATNPRTGQTVVFRGGQWHAALGAGATAASPTTAARGNSAEAKAQVVAQNKLKAAISIERMLNRVSRLYNRDLKGVGPGSVLEYLPSQRNSQFNEAANAMRPFLKGIIRDPGEGAFTDADQALLNSLVPDTHQLDGANEERMRQLRGIISDARRNAGVPDPNARQSQFRIVRR
jgi:hypothetical protein